MRQAKKARKKILFPNSVQNRTEQEIPKKIKKNKKTSFRQYFQPKRDEIGLKRDKKILVLNSVITQPGQENSEKNSKKIQKIKKPRSSIIISQNGVRQAEKEKKKFSHEFRFYLTRARKFRKKIDKKFKKLKNLIPELFLAKL